MADQLPRRQHNQQQVNRPPSHETEGESVAENINTKAATPIELLEEKVLSLYSQVMRKKINAGQAVAQLHEFWRTEFTSEERDELCSPDKVNVIEIGKRFQLAADVLGSEMPSLIASHNSSKGL